MFSDLGGVCRSTSGRKSSRLFKIFAQQAVEDCRQESGYMARLARLEKIVLAATAWAKNGGRA